MKLKETWTILAIIFLYSVLVISLPIGEEENEVTSNSTDLQHELDKWTEDENEGEKKHDQLFGDLPINDQMKPLTVPSTNFF